jgi:tRNA 2-thiocytidine biosynthesis protein TtcA
MLKSSPERLAYWLLKTINPAIREWNMIADGDRVAVAVSGGKDSLSLLRLLDLRRAAVPERYELAALHVPGDANGPAAAAHAPLLEWLAARGYETIIAPFNLTEGEALPIDCPRCTRLRRKALFEAAHSAGCRVVAFGHHADDLAQTTLLNLLYHGRAETMPPVRDYFDGAVRLIRPLCFTREKDIRRFARACDFPPPPPACPLGDRTRRQLARDLLAQAEEQARDAVKNLCKAGLGEG